MIEASPSLPLIATTHEEEWLADIVSAQDTYSPYYMGVKYGTLTCVDDNVSTLLSLVEVAIAANAYKWKTLFNTLDLDYNPIWNYDGETITETVYGARDENNIRGARDSSNILAQTHVTSENAQAPYDSSTLKDTSKNEVTGDAHTDRYTSESYTDEFTTEEYTDTTTETKHGNQGTTTTQKMITEERAIANMDYINTVYKDIIDTITYPFYS